jgi:hypothetical protein
MPIIYYVVCLLAILCCCLLAPRVGASSACKRGTNMRVYGALALIFRFPRAGLALSKLSRALTSQDLAPCYFHKPLSSGRTGCAPLLYSISLLRDFRC